ncbi:MAG TPA: gliding motility-associated C-terminal domain-containing protein [Flavobacterium sp.]|nr:gliding motility-associated C-terminal domain-containing protein [Flavobacterium sp.]
MKGINVITILMLLSVAAKAQVAHTVNEGDLVVEPGTVMTVIGDFTNSENGLNTGTVNNEGQVTIHGNFENTELGHYTNDGEIIFHGNFKNDGITTFSPDKNGYTRFEGTSQQKIEGSVPADFYDVLFNNPNGTATQPAFQLFGDISISGNADFYEGIVKDDEFGGIITFENNATHSNVDHDSHVDGYVLKNGSPEFTYPIGDQDPATNARFYRYAAISAPGEDLSSFEAKYFYENSNALYTHESKVGIIDIINDKEYWTIEKEGGEADVMLTLSWDTSVTTPAYIVAEPYENIHIVRWKDRSGMGMPGIWVDEGGVANPAAGTITTAVEVDGYGVFTLARIKENVALPGDVVVYNGVTPNGDGENDHFIIEHLKDFPKNSVEIYNRWGVKVFETKGYDQNGNVFKGYSEGRVTVNKNEMLPTGTYFYVIEYLYEREGEESRMIKETGYLYLSSD